MPTKPDEAHTLYVTLLYFISIQQFNLQISKHTPHQENYFSYHISTTFLSLWHPSMRYQRLNRRKCCPLFSIHWIQHLFTGKANLCYKYLHLLTTTCPDSLPTEVPGWELGEDAGFRFQAPWEGGTWSAVVTCSLFVQVSHDYIGLHWNNHIWPKICVKRPKVSLEGCFRKSEKKATPEWSGILFNLCFCNYIGLLI